MSNDNKGLKKVVKGRAVAIKKKVGNIAGSAADKKDDVKNQLIVVADAAVDGVQKGGRSAAVKIGDAKIAIDKRRFRPVFPDEFLSEDYDVPNLVWLRKKDPHPALLACEGAVGYEPKIGKIVLLELINNDVSDQKLTFFPNLDEALYYRNPYVKNFYVNINEYFDYIKKERVNELVNIAHKLGAKHVKIVFKEEKKVFASAAAEKKEKQKVKGVQGAEDKVGVKGQVKDLLELEVASEMTFEGNDEPEVPELVYFKNNSDIENLITMCVEKKNPPKTKSYTLKYNRSSDINLEVAANIDFVLSKLSMTATASVKSEVEKENRLYMEYLIKF